MNIIIDTSVWSLALRRIETKNQREVTLLQTFLKESDKTIWLPGIVTLELLQGIQRPSHFDKLKESLLRFPFLEPVRDDYIYASEVVNYCMGKGVQISTIDALIAALTLRREYFLLTTDKDFQHIAKHFPLKLI